PTIQKLYVDGQKEIDKEKRIAMYAQLQDIYIKAAPVVFMYESPYTVALRKPVQGFVQIPLGNNIFKGVHIEK
ncbi:MAG TPA: ABC transporter substrate-binding protein, partial [Dongiaceae bacterium]